MDAEALTQKMKEKHIGIGEMCRMLGMSRSAFYRKTKGISEFRLAEINSICAILDLDSPEGIFFARKVS